MRRFKPLKKVGRKPKTPRIPWSETPAGVAHAKEQAEYQAWVDGGGPERVDPALCFTCQEKPPTKLMRRGKKEFRVCDECCRLAQSENARRNGILTALGRGQGGRILQYVLGMDLCPTWLRVEKL